MHIFPVWNLTITCIHIAASDTLKTNFQFKKKVVANPHDLAQWTSGLLCRNNLCNPSALLLQTPTRQMLSILV